MHYIFIISFGKTKIFKFQIYYFLKEIMIIIKTYHAITINITQIIERHIQIQVDDVA